jgi:outer membrane protein TolC
MASSVKLFWLILVWSAIPVAGQNALSLEQAAQRASAQNRDVRQARAGIQVRAEEATAARTRRWPSLTTSVQAGPILNHASGAFSQGILGNYAATGPIPSQNTEVNIPRRIGGYEYSQISMPLSQQARLKAGVKLAEGETNVAREQAESLRLSAIAQVRDLYFQIAALETARRAANKQLEAAGETARLALEGVAKGTALPLDEAAAGAKLGQAQADVTNLETDIRNGREQLNLLMGEPLDAQFVLTDNVPPAAVLTFEEARRRALETKPEIKEARSRLEQAGLSVHSKRLEEIPDVNLTLTHVAFFNSSNYLPNQFAIAGLSLSWEPWDWGRKRHEAAGLRDKEEQARLVLAQVREQVTLEADRAWRELGRAQRNLEAARLTTKSSEENLRVVRQRHEKEAALLRDLLEAQTNWEAAGQQEARAVAAVGIAWANLQSAIGAEP